MSEIELKETTSVSTKKSKSLKTFNKRKKKLVQLFTLFEPSTEANFVVSDPKYFHPVSEQLLKYIVRESVEDTVDEDFDNPETKHAISVNEIELGEAKSNDDAATYQLALRSELVHVNSREAWLESFKIVSDAFNISETMREGSRGDYTDRNAAAKFLFREMRLKQLDTLEEHTYFKRDAFASDVYYAAWMRKAVAAITLDLKRIGDELVAQHHHKRVYWRSSFRENFYCLRRDVSKKARYNDVFLESKKRELSAADHVTEYHEHYPRLVWQLVRDQQKEGGVQEHLIDSKDNAGINTHFSFLSQERQGIIDRYASAFALGDAFPSLVQLDVLMKNRGYSEEFFFSLGMILEHLHDVKIDRPRKGFTVAERRAAATMLVDVFQWSAQCFIAHKKIFPTKGVVNEATGQFNLCAPDDMKPVEKALRHCGWCLSITWVLLTRFMQSTMAMLKKKMPLGKSFETFIGELWVENLRKEYDELLKLGVLEEGAEQKGDALRVEDAAHLHVLLKQCVDLIEYDRYLCQQAILKSTKLEFVVKSTGEALFSWLIADAKAMFQSIADDPATLHPDHPGFDFFKKFNIFSFVVVELGINQGTVTKQIKKAMAPLVNRWIDQLTFNVTTNAPRVEFKNNTTGKFKLDTLFTYFNELAADVLDKDKNPQFKAFVPESRGYLADRFALSVKTLYGDLVMGVWAECKSLNAEVKRFSGLSDMVETKTKTNKVKFVTLALERVMCLLDLVRTGLADVISEVVNNKLITYHGDLPEALPIFTSLHDLYYAVIQRWVAVVCGPLAAKECQDLVVREPITDSYKGKIDTELRPLISYIKTVFVQLKESGLREDQTQMLARFLLFELFKIFESIMRMSLRKKNATPLLPSQAKRIRSSLNALRSMFDKEMNVQLSEGSMRELAMMQVQMKKKATDAAEADAKLNKKGRAQFGNGKKKKEKKKKQWAVDIRGLLPLGPLNPDAQALNLMNVAHEMDRTMLLAKLLTSNTAAMKELYDSFPRIIADTGEEEIVVHARAIATVSDHAGVKLGVLPPQMLRVITRRAELGEQEAIDFIGDDGREQEAAHDERVFSTEEDDAGGALLDDQEDEGSVSTKLLNLFSF